MKCDRYLSNGGISKETQQYDVLKKSDKTLGKIKNR